MLSSSPSSPPDPTVKRITLTGSAAADFSGGQQKKERKRSVKKSVTGGESAPSPAPALPSSAPSAPSAPSASSAPSAPSASSPLSAPSISEGGTKRIRVELKKRASTKKVHLQPKSVKKVSVLSSSSASPAPTPSSSSSSSSSSPSTASQTKKARKVTLGVKALHKRMSRAKKMTRKVKEMSLTQLREHLIQKKLIKPTSKAPEAVLRQMAADAQIVAGRAL